MTSGTQVHAGLPKQRARALPRSRTPTAGTGAADIPHVATRALLTG